LFSPGISVLWKTEAKVAMRPGIDLAKEAERSEPTKCSAFSRPIGQGKPDHDEGDSLNHGEPTEQNADDHQRPADEVDSESLRPTREHGISTPKDEKRPFRSGLRADISAMPGPVL
jgi:hypothetical protein